MFPSITPYAVLRTPYSTLYSLTEAEKLEKEKKRGKLSCGLRDGPDQTSAGVTIESIEAFCESWMID